MAGSTQVDAPLLPLQAPDATPASCVLTRLRAETGDLHRQLESRFDAVTMLQTSGGKTAFCRRFHLLHRSVEEPLAAWLSAIPDLELPRRRRAASFAATLADCRFDTHRTPPRLASRAEALGLLYVIEGSTLGGRIILKQLAALGIDRRGLDFLDPYGAETGRMWRQFLAVLAREAGSAAAVKDAVRGARNGFAWAQSCLCDPAEAA